MHGTTTTVSRNREPGEPFGTRCLRNSGWHPVVSAHRHCQGLSCFRGEGSGMVLFTDIALLKYFYASEYLRYLMKGEYCVREYRFSQHRVARETIPFLLAIAKLQFFCSNHRCSYVTFITELLSYSRDGSKEGMRVQRKSIFCTLCFHSFDTGGGERLNQNKICGGENPSAK